MANRWKDYKWIAATVFGSAVFALGFWLIDTGVLAALKVILN